MNSSNQRVWKKTFRLFILMSAWIVILKNNPIKFKAPTLKSNYDRKVNAKMSTLVQPPSSTQEPCINPQVYCNVSFFDPYFIPLHKSANMFAVLQNRFLPLKNTFFPCSCSGIYYACTSMCTHRCLSDVEA